MRRVGLAAAMTGLMLALAASHASRAAVAGGSFASEAPDDQGAADQHLAILEFRVLHNSVLDIRQVESAVYPHLGPDRTFADVQAARAQLEKAYHDAGYSSVYVDIPEQTVEGGIVRLTVTEGRLAHIRVHGAHYFMNGRILAAVPALQPGAVPYFAAVQQQVNALNQASPDLRVAPVLKAGPTPGTVDAELKVSDTAPVHASVEVNDRYTASTAHTRLNINLSYGNLFQRYQTLSLQYQTAPEQPSDSRVLAATYLAPLQTLHSTLALFAIKTDSDVATVGTLGVIGKGRVFGSRYIANLPSSGSLQSSVTLGADLKDFGENVLLESAPSVQTPIKYMNWSVTYAASLAHEHVLTSFDVATNFGVRGLVNDPAEFDSKRYLAPANYMYWHADLSHLRPLVFGSEIALRATGQYTVDPLIDNEQFAIGGVDSVRGYLEAEELGDLGYTASAELRSPRVGTLFGVHPREVYLYAFYDAGMARLLEPLPGQTARFDMRGTGVGFRVAGYAGFDAEFDWARALVATTYERAGSSRVHFYFRYGF